MVYDTFLNTEGGFPPLTSTMRGHAQPLLHPPDNGQLAPQQVNNELRRGAPTSLPPPRLLRLLHLLHSNSHPVQFVGPQYGGHLANL